MDQVNSAKISLQSPYQGSFSPMSAMSVKLTNQSMSTEKGIMHLRQNKLKKVKNRNVRRSSLRTNKMYLIQNLKAKKHHDRREALLKEAGAVKKVKKDRRKSCFSKRNEVNDDVSREDYRNQRYSPSQAINVRRMRAGGMKFGGQERKMSSSRRESDHEDKGFFGKLFNFLGCADER